MVYWDVCVCTCLCVWMFTNVHVVECVWVCFVYTHGLGSSRFHVGSRRRAEVTRPGPLIRLSGPGVRRVETFWSTNGSFDCVRLVPYNPVPTTNTGRGRRPFLKLIVFFVCTTSVKGCGLYTECLGFEVSDPSVVPDLLGVLLIASGTPWDPYSCLQ